jgi:hypothetical protein
MYQYVSPMGMMNKNILIIMLVILAWIIARYHLQIQNNLQIEAFIV